MCVRIIIAYRVYLCVFYVWYMRARFYFCGPKAVICAIICFFIFLLKCSKILITIPEFLHNLFRAFCISRFSSYNIPVDDSIIINV